MSIGGDGGSDFDQGFTDGYSDVDYVLDQEALTLIQFCQNKITVHTLAF